LWHVARYPGVFLWRRLCALLLDFAASGILLAAGGAVTLPIFGAILWVTVGYGIRYGGQYLILSGLCAQITMAIVIATSAYLQANPFLAAALMITLLIGPSYAFALIHRLQIAYDEAKVANSQKSHFVAQVSHDIRQPIHAISFLTSRLGDTELSAEQAGLVTQIDRSLSAAIQQLQTFLNITTIEAGLLKPSLEPVDIGELLNSQILQQQPIATSLGNSVHVSNTSYVVRSDPIYLTTIVQNLLSNAIKHAPGADILLGCRRHRGKLAICVYDRGPGVDPDSIARLTDSYFRAGSRNDARKQGTGLGLAIVKTLCEDLGLAVEIISHKGKGTAVRITGLEMTTAAVSKPAEPNHAPFNQLSDIRISLVEDDAATLEATRGLLLRWGCEVETYVHPCADAAKCDILISDYEFADGSTMTTHDALWSPMTPMIIVSGHSRGKIIMPSTARVIAVLEKPVRATELRSALMAGKLATSG
jgi:signal transduction histidine kinase